MWASEDRCHASLYPEGLWTGSRLTLQDTAGRLQSHHIRSQSTFHLYPRYKPDCSTRLTLLTKAEKIKWRILRFLGFYVLIYFGFFLKMEVSAGSEATGISAIFHLFPLRLLTRLWCIPASQQGECWDSLYLTPWPWLGFQKPACIITQPVLCIIMHARCHFWM